MYIILLILIPLFVRSFSETDRRVFQTDSAESSQGAATEQRIHRTHK